MVAEERGREEERRDGGREEGVVGEMALGGDGLRGEWYISV